MCSVETYSSPSGRAICSAAPRALTNSRDSVGSATLGPAALGRLSTARAAARRTSAGFAPTARSSAVAVDPPVSSRASSRCHGSTVAWPFLLAMATAEVMTSRLFVVRRSAFMAPCWISLTPDNRPELSLAHSTMVDEPPLSARTARQQQQLAKK
jgi:hypothetical protein